jgi:predicted transcriptional regulator
MHKEEAMHHSPTPVHDTPTVDELEALKSLEMGGALSVPEALHQHLSGRLLEYGYVERDARGEVVITAKGRTLIRRQDA